MKVVGTVPSGGRTIRKLNFAVEPGIVVPALDIASAEAPGASPTLVKVGLDWSKGGDLDQPGALDALLKSRGHVVLIQPRGMGETAPTGQSGRDWPFGRDWKEAFLAIHLSRPLVGQRAVDVLAVLEALRAERAGEAFHVVGVGTGGPIVLHAAILDEKSLITEVTVERSIRSWDDVVRQAISKDQLANVVPGALAFYDLPDLVARIAPRPVHTAPAGE